MMAPSWFKVVLLAAVLGLGSGCSDDDPLVDSGGGQDLSVDMPITPHDGVPDAPPADLAPDKAVKPDLAPDKAVKPDLAPDKAVKPDLAPDQTVTPDLAPDTAPAPDLAPDMSIPMPDLGPSPGCGPAKPAFGGTLCGASKPCKVKINEQLPGSPGYFHGGPALALDSKGTQRVLFMNGATSYTTYHGVRQGPNNWKVVTTPMSFRTAGMVLDGAGTAHALVHHKFAKGGQLWSDTGTGWKLKNTLSPSLASTTSAETGWANGLALDGGGCLHAMMSGSWSSTYLRRDKSNKWTAWSLQSGGSQDGAPLALSPAGRPHVAYWSSSGSSGWSLYWQAPKGPREKVSGLGSNVYSHETVSLAVSAKGTAETPHLFFMRQKSAPYYDVHDLVYATRQKGGWTKKTVASDTANTCKTTPCTLGATCKYDYVAHSVLALVVSGNGDVRLIYAPVRFQGTMHGTYYYGCMWNKGNETVTGKINVARIAGGKVVASTLLSGVHPYPGDTAQAILDAKGDIHLAFNAYTTYSVYARVIRYVKLGQ